MRAAFNTIFYAANQLAAAVVDLGNAVFTIAEVENSGLCRPF
jgi:hypothetical protein